eukprot:TRINITY_DN1486_c0_g1_i3.p1 TRINITY_DN1486_c0_g1~~TRINITY_DN1486_c0_g1_i3.p1  ORF type:complete len:171 (-),score=8.54 TRINITY_DN1486_c0_g1_i3:105-581(-)
MVGLLKTSSGRGMASIAMRSGLQLQTRFFSQRSNPVYPSPWNKWFPHEPIPSTPQVGPYKVKVVGGQTYWFCTCGESSTQPWCEAGPSCCKLPPFKPTAYVPIHTTTVAMCGCKKSPSPECNMTHRLLQADLYPVQFAASGFVGCFVIGLLLAYNFHP